MSDLRPYQVDVIGRYRAAVDAGQKRILMVAPTGAGKTVIGSAIVNTTVESGRRVLFFSHRREITKQTCEKLFALGIDAGIIQAGWPARPCQSVQVASVQTLTARAIRGSLIELPPADLVVVDEAHHATADTYRKIIDRYPDSIVLGLTATPCRKDGRGLGNIFEVLIECPQVQELIDLGFLVATVVYGPAEAPDLQGVRIQAGDYVESQLAERMNTHKLVGDAVTHWFRHAERRQTVVFAIDVAHSRHLCDEFREAGVRAEHIDGSTPKEERDAILGKLARGEIEVVCNCQVLTEGWDCPEVSCLVLARPTKSLGLYRQMIGRGLRPAPGKVDCVVLDHAGATIEHGFAEDRVQWTLSTDRRAQNTAHAARKATGARSRLCDCPRCGAIRTAGERCRSCGFLPQRQPQSVDFIDGDLARLDRNRQPIVATADKVRWQRELIHIANSRGYRPGWAAHKYREKFGHWPKRNDVHPLPASGEVLAWVRSRQIAYSKAMVKAAQS
jgi:superfamily II DNA or RNA helicase